MRDVLGQVMGLKRPNLLVRAARYGVDDYVRETHLRRYLSENTIPTPARALVALLDIEKQFNSERLIKSGNYSVARHIDILVAIMAEARTFRDSMAASVRLI